MWRQRYEKTLYSMLKFAVNLKILYFYIFYCLLYWVFIVVLGLSLIAAPEFIDLWQEGSQFPDQGSNPHPQHWKADSETVDHQRNPLKIL